MIKKVSNLLIFAIAIILIGTINTNAANSCSGCGTYTYVEQSSSNGIVGYCIDPNLPGGLKSASSYAPSAKLTGEILDWAQGFNTAKKQQIAYRLISFENGLGSSVTSTNYKQCILNGCFTSDAEYMEVYNSWKTRTSKKVNQNVSGIIITGGAVTKKDGKFSTTLHVEAGSLTVYLSVDNSRASLSKTEIHGKGDVVVSGTLNDECTGEALVVTASATNKTSTPGDNCKNTSGMVEFYYYASRPGYQSFIVPVPQEKEIPGKCNGGDNGKPTSSTLEQRYEIDIDPEECNEGDCGADISENFTCSGQGQQNKYLHETDNIASCILSGKYKKYCDDNSIKKETDNEGKKTDTTDKGNIAQIDLGENNPYCSVYCKEDIDYVLPGEQYAKNGTYFSFKNQDMKITGKRSCYTTKIKTSDYIDDVKEAQQAVLTAYKNLKEAEAKLKSKENATKTESSCTVNTNCGGTGTSGKGTWYDGTPEEYTYYTASYDAHGGILGALIPNKGSVEEEWGVKYDPEDKSCTTGTGENKKSLTGRTCKKTTVAETIINISEYKIALNTAQENLLKVIQNYKSCFEWNNNYCFNPKITYSYEEVYDISGEIGSKPVSTNSTSEEVYGDKNYTNKVADAIDKESKSFVYCENGGCSLQTTDLNMTAKFVKKTIEKEKVFTGKIEGKEVCTYHPDGTIFVGKNECNKEKNTVMLDGDGYVFPVALEHTNSKIKYDYQLNISNIGAPGNDDSCDLDNLDRLTGNNCSLYEKSESITGQTGTNYICQYSSCPECKTKCTCDNYSGSGKCIEKDDYTCLIVEVCDECPVICIGCIWSSDDISFGYKQISLTELFPNANTNNVGYNWNTNPEINKDYADKAQAAIDAIQNEAEEIYKKPEYSYVLSPMTMAKIREYNKEANKNSTTKTWGEKKSNHDNVIPKGGYSNATLTCVNGEKCTSSFLDGLVQETNMKKDEYIRNTKWKVFNKDTKKWEEK